MKKIRFDTRDKKPVLYGLLIPTAIAAAAIAVLWRMGAERYAAAMLGVTAALCVCVIVSLLRALRGQLEYNPYSYNVIYYVGFALFALFVLLSHAVLALRLLRQGSAIDAGEIVSLLLGSAKSFMLLTAPFLLAFSAALCVSNVSLIRHEGRRFVNLLGISLSFLIVAGAAALFAFDFAPQSGGLLRVLLGNLAAAVYLYFECMLIGTIAADAIAARSEPEKDRDYLIILGCGIRKDGTPTALLRGRIERALAFASAQKAETGKELTFVTSGGQGPNEVISESAAMKGYLLSRGVPEERIVEEDRSTSTYENMLFSKEKIRSRDPDAKVAFSTTNYHVFRGGLLARRVKMRAVGMGADTKWYFWPNAAVREFAGLLVNHRGKQALILGGMLAVYAALTYLTYR